MLKGRIYNITIILRVIAKADRVVNMSELADACDVSWQYTEMMLSDLRSCSLIKGKRGPGGGYTIYLDEVANWSMIDLARKLYPDQVANIDPLITELLAMPLTDVISCELPSTVLSRMQCPV